MIIRTKMLQKYSEYICGIPEIHILRIVPVTKSAHAVLGSGYRRSSRQSSKLELPTIADGRYCISQNCEVHWCERAVEHQNVTYASLGELHTYSERYANCRFLVRKPARCAGANAQISFEITSKPREQCSLEILDEVRANSFKLVGKVARGREDSQRIWKIPKFPKFTSRAFSVQRPMNQHPTRIAKTQLNF